LVATTTAGWRKHADLTFEVMEYNLLKISDLKRRLGDGWPDWARGG
jgi:hypothetical protein